MCYAPFQSEREEDEFLIKLTKFQFLTPFQRREVLAWYRGYQDTLRASYEGASDYVLHNPEILAGERVWIMHSIDYRLHRVQAELGWLDQQLANSTQEERSDPA